jgi:hypothetical protein
VNPRGITLNVGRPGILGSENSLQSDQIFGRGLMRIPRMGTGFIRVIREDPRPILRVVLMPSFVRQLRA